MREALNQRWLGPGALVAAGVVAGALGAVFRLNRSPRAMAPPAEQSASRALRERLGNAIDAGAATELVPDELIAEHVRRQLDRPYLSHPGLLDVHVYGGRVLITGAVLRAEVEDMIQRLVRVPGVRHFDSRLRVVESGEELAQISQMLPESPAHPPSQRRWLRALQTIGRLGHRAGS